MFDEIACGAADWFLVKTFCGALDGGARLEAAGLDAWAPTISIRRIRRPAGRVQRRAPDRQITPLWPSYVFLRADPAATAFLRSWTRGAAVRQADGTPLLLAGESMRAVVSLARAQARKRQEQEAAPLSPGDRVRIAEGVLAGYIAVVERRRGQAVALQLPGSEVKFEISSENVARCCMG